MLEVLNLNENNCADCYKCIRTCSVKAITYANDTAEIVHDECILCGNCFVACPQKAKQVRNDVPASRRPLPRASMWCAAWPRPSSRISASAPWT